jgi:prophage antirepressor-like protein
MFGCSDAGSKRRESNVYIWFRSKDVASVLGYTNTIQALIKNVDEDDKTKMEELGGGA